MANGGDRELGLFGDWESACAMLQCNREECMTTDDQGRHWMFQEVLPYMATVEEVQEAFERHLRTHK